MSYAIDRQGASLPLVNIDEEKILKWSKVLEKIALKYGEIYLISDTETTGTQIVDPKTKLFSRVLEWSIAFAYKDAEGIYHQILDDAGVPIEIDEPINPFIEKAHSKKQKQSINYIPKETVEVHGITEEYLFGEDNNLRRPRLTTPAAPFVFVFQALTNLLNFPAFRDGTATIYLVFHNADFDVRFLNHEMDMNGLPPIESYFLIICSEKDLATKLLSKKEVANYKLDTLFEFMVKRYPEQVTPLERPLHTALGDSLILLQTMNGLSLKLKELNQ